MEGDDGEVGKIKSCGIKESAQIINEPINCCATVELGDWFSS